MLHYADATIDTGVGNGIAPFEAALKANNKKYEVFIYEGAQHGFHNDTTPRYDEKSATPGSGAPVRASRPSRRSAAWCRCGSRAARPRRCRRVRLVVRLQRRLERRDAAADALSIVARRSAASAAP